MWQSVNTLHGRGRVNEGDIINSNQFHQFFVNKVAAVHTTMADGPSTTSSLAPIAAAICDFQRVTIDEALPLIRRLPDKSCASDVLPTPQFNCVVDLIGLSTCELFNHLLSMATVPAAFKSAYITLLLKKPDMNTVNVRFYRPISNLSMVSKLLEHTVPRHPGWRSKYATR